jgi:hypothetical protein
MRAIKTSKKRAGFTAAEVAMSALIVGLLMAVALNTAGASARSQIDNVDRARGMLFASALLAEILAQPFEDSVSPVFGRESGEGSGDRSDWDDVDDYHNWTSSPPENKQGATLSNATGLTISSAVSLANPSDLRAGASGGVAELKWVTVTVSRGGKTIATVEGVASK